MSALLVRVSARILAVLPLRLIHALAVPAAWLLGAIPWRKHKVVRRNLETCFPELLPAQRRGLEQAQRIELLRLAGELGALAHWSARRLARHIQTGDDWAHVEHAVAQGRGLLLVSGHLGNWEILNLTLSQRLSLVTLYKAPDDPALDDFISRARGRFGGTLVASGSATMRELLRQLRRGGCVAIAADIQPKDGDGVFTPFFGQPALTMTLVNRLARKTGCAVVFCRAERRTRGRGWRLIFSPASGSIAGPEPVEALSEMNDWLTESIRQKPAQYLWIYKRFSRRPAGEARFYP